MSGTAEDLLLIPRFFYQFHKFLWVVSTTKLTYTYKLTIPNPKLKIDHLKV